MSGGQKAEVSLSRARRFRRRPVSNRSDLPLSHDVRLPDSQGSRGQSSWIDLIKCAIGHLEAGRLVLTLGHVTYKVRGRRRPSTASFESYPPWVATHPSLVGGHSIIAYRFFLPCSVKLLVRLCGAWPHDALNYCFGVRPRGRCWSILLPYFPATVALRNPPERASAGSLLPP